MEERLCVAAARLGQHTAEEMKKGDRLAEVPSRFGWLVNNFDYFWIQDGL